jgi:hypothetical protein
MCYSAFWGTGNVIISRIFSFSRTLTEYQFHVTNGTAKWGADQKKEAKARKSAFLRDCNMLYRNLYAVMPENKLTKQNQNLAGFCQIVHAFTDQIQHYIFSKVRIKAGYIYQWHRLVAHAYFTPFCLRSRRENLKMEDGAVGPNSDAKWWLPLLWGG